MTEVPIPLPPLVLVLEHKSIDGFGAQGQSLLLLEPPTNLLWTPLGLEFLVNILHQRLRHFHGFRVRLLSLVGEALSLLTPIPPLPRVPLELTTEAGVRAPHHRRDGSTSLASLPHELQSVPFLLRQLRIRLAHFGTSSFG